MNIIDPKVELVTVTPELAREWLTHNTHNRPLRIRAVQAYAADIMAGDWKWNGESIKFADDPAQTLLDGQNRLHAVIEADTAVPMLVVHRLPVETQQTMDGGAKRKFSDVLSLKGETHCIALASLVRKVAVWKAGYRKGGQNFTPTNAQLLQTLDAHPELRDLAAEANRVAAKCALPGSVIGLTWWLFAGIDETSVDDAQFFFERVGDWQGLTKGDPIYELRKAADASKTVRGQRSQTFLTAITIKAWNAYRDGKPLGLLAYKPGGANPERFPEPK